MAPSRKHKVTVIGSGNWGSAIAKIVAENTKQHSDIFEEVVQMWVFEENFVLPKTSRHYTGSSQGPQKLTGLINHYHENVKYLPGIRLPENLHANPSIQDAVKDSDILIFNLPHQFIAKTCEDLVGHIVPYARAISCIKGVAVSADSVSLFSDVIGEKLGIYCGALSGANIANEIGLEKFSETTVAYDEPEIDKRSGKSGGNTKLTPVPEGYPVTDFKTLKTLFHRPYFHVRLVSDVAATSLAGALKNVVALAAGWVVGLGWGDNAKAAIMRVGLLEMVKFGHVFFEEKGIRTETFTEESAGVADLITSCSGGRNFRCAQMSIERKVPIKEVERTELNGQSLQGIGTAYEVNSFLRARGMEEEFPLMTAVYNILEGKAQAKELPDLIEKTPTAKL